MRLRTPVGLLVGAAVLSLTMATQAAPPGVAKTTHNQLKRTPQPPVSVPRYHGPTELRSPVLVFVGIPVAFAGIAGTIVSALEMLGIYNHCQAGTTEADKCGGLEPLVKLPSVVGATMVTGLGFTLLDIGAQRVPRARPSATLAPWLGPNQGGLTLQLRL